MLLDDIRAIAAEAGVLSRSVQRVASLRPGFTPHPRQGLDPEPDGGLPPELAFLLAQGVLPDLLRRASHVAERAGVPGEAALFGLGFSDERYYRLLARHLGAHHLDRPMALARDGIDRLACSTDGRAPLAPNSLNLRHVLAPGGEILRGLLRRHRFADGGTYDFAITTQRRLDALLRRLDQAGLCESAASSLANWDVALSARGGASSRQARTMLGVAAVLAFAFAAAPGLAWIGTSIALFVIFTATVALRLWIVGVSPAPRDCPPAPRPDSELPVYTLIVPLFHEARVLEQLVGNLDALDYPAAKLDIKLMLEDGDRATILAAARLSLPARYDVIVLPAGHPRTKPRALNAALQAARGEFVVVYDAEDRPDPGQLRTALAHFEAAPAGLACLQARLTIDHADETWITRMFALDYAALFLVVKPGLAALNLPVPLGGTSNHFRATALRRVGGWDAWNVTEDIDLGYRLARFGYAVGSLDSDTFEEAPLTLARWLPQRSRWLKGWMVTLLVHTRQPRRLFGELGWRAGLSVLVSLSGTVLSCLLGPPLLVLMIVEGACGTLFRSETPLWWMSVAAGSALLTSGAAAAIWPIVKGLQRMGRMDLARWIVLLPFYLTLVSVASWRAVFELWRDPQGWNKTEHGLARGRSGGAASVHQGRRSRRKP